MKKKDFTYGRFIKLKRSKRIQEIYLSGNGNIFALIKGKNVRLSYFNKPSEEIIKEIINKFTDNNKIKENNHGFETKNERVCVTDKPISNNYNATVRKYVKR